VPSLRALPGRVILEFERPKEKTIGGVIIPETSQLRPEFGTSADIGEALNDDERRIASALWDLKAAGKKIAVSFAAGVSYWRDYDRQALDEKEWGWLKSVKSYRMAELASYVEE
jgi:co-chaperonin GroES (HSP10)